MKTIYIFLIIICIILYFLFSKSEQLNIQNKPPFLYPTLIPQPPGPYGWGYRDPSATYNTLLWEENHN